MALSLEGFLGYRGELAGGAIIMEPTADQEQANEARSLMSTALSATMRDSTLDTAVPNAHARTYEAVHQNETYRILIPSHSETRSVTVSYPDIQLKNTHAILGRSRIHLSEGQLPTVEFVPEDKSESFNIPVSPQLLRLVSDKIGAAGDFSLIGGIPPQQEVPSQEKAA